MLPKCHFNQAKHILLLYTLIMKHYKLTIITAVMALTFAIPAYAYLDPGSGSIILQGILAAIAGMMAAIKLYWRKLKNFCRRCLGKPIEKEPKKKQDDEHSKN